MKGWSLLYMEEWKIAKGFAQKDIFWCFFVIFKVDEMKSKASKLVAKGTASVLNAFLKADANSASCLITYQPKVPKELTKYRRTK